MGENIGSVLDRRLVTMKMLLVTLIVFIGVSLLATYFALLRFISSMHPSLITILGIIGTWLFLLSPMYCCFACAIYDGYYLVSRFVSFKHNVDRIRWLDDAKKAMINDLLYSWCKHKVDTWVDDATIAAVLNLLYLLMIALFFVPPYTGIALIIAAISEIALVGYARKQYTST